MQDKKRERILFYFPLTLLLIVIVFRMGFLLKNFLPKDNETEPQETVVIEKRNEQLFTRKVPLPMEINQNFLTQVNECFIPTATAYGYTLRIVSGFRSLEEQSEIYDQGRVESGNIVSWAIPGKSMHNYGYAVDVVDRWRGYYINWKRLGRIANFCGLTQVDDPHFEYRGGLSTAQFEAGLKPAPLTLPCNVMSEKAKLNLPLTQKDLESCGAENFWSSR
jgi:hypothetical protein